MNQTLLILAAHGCREDRCVNGRLADLAKSVERDSRYDQVTVAFHSGEPTFSNVLDGQVARAPGGDDHRVPHLQRRWATRQPRACAWGLDCVVVVPLMTSAGYFSSVVLPRELARNERFPEVQVRITKPVGAHPGMTELVVRRVRTLLEAHDLDPADTALAVVGHGTPRHRESCRATVDLAAQLRTMALCAEVVPAFLDQSPQVPTIIDRTTKPLVLVIPFMIADGPHTTRDIPARLGMSLGDDITFPARGRVADRRIVYDRAIGEDPGLLPLITSLAEEFI